MIALGEFIPYEWLTEPIKDAMSKGEDDNSNVLANMGIMLMILLFVIVIITLVIACVKLCKEGTKCHTLLLWLKKKLLWNFVIRTILQSYLKIAIGCCLAIWLVNFDKTIDVVNAVLAIVFLIVISLLPFLLGRIVLANKLTLSSE